MSDLVERKLLHEARIQLDELALALEAKDKELVALKERILELDTSTIDELNGCREAMKKERIKAAKSAVMIEDLNNMVLRYMVRAETAERERDEARKALKHIAAIENREYGSDWEEIEEAREIANRAITRKDSP